MTRRLLLVGAVALAACALGWWVDPTQFFRSYLLAFLFWLGIALGCLPIRLLHNMAGGDWGLVIRRALEAALATLPVLALLFVPIALGLPRLYEWAQPDRVAADAILQHKSAYLNVPFFLCRAVLYFAAWIGAARLIEHLTVDARLPDDDPAARRLRVVSGPCLALYGATMSFAAIDWSMSLDPHWSSTMYPVIVTGGQVLTALAFAIAVTVARARRERLVAAVAPGLWQDLGNLLLAFTMLWAYFGISQYLIMWSGNLPEEISWYLNRTGGGWGAIALLLIAGQFVLPFFVLLSADAKRRAGVLGTLAAFVVCARFVDLVWLVVPTFEPHALRLHWMDVVAPIGVGGIWLAAFTARLESRPLLPEELAHAGY